jgi:hypothetical protein
MKNLILLSIVFLGACTSAIKDEKSQKEEPTSEGVELKGEFRPDPNGNFIVNEREDLIGYWVGWFKPDLTKAQRQKLSEQEYYPSRNKVNISIDRFQGDSVYGHSVVANNNRPFKGIMMTSGMSYSFDVVEPGDDKHDGHFLFQIDKRDSVIRGNWTAYSSRLHVSKRSYELSKKIFVYNPYLELEFWYTDESKHPNHDSINLVQFLAGSSFDEALRDYMEYSDDEFDDMSAEDKLNQLDKILMEINEYEVYTVSDKFDNFNSSKDILTVQFVSELSKADIYIMRNSIYARHGYSFKKKDLINYFDNQDWYIPVHANIATDLTEIEKQNIKLLLSFEEHAEEYYDQFGR